MKATYGNKERRAYVWRAIYVYKYVYIGIRVQGLGEFSTSIKKGYHFEACAECI